MRPIDYIATFAIAAAVAVLLGFALVSGRLPPALRSKIERVLGWLFWPAIVVFWSWRSVYFALEGNWFAALMMVVVAVTSGWTGLKAIREGRLLPLEGRRNER
jgi:hypothetical protein